MLVHSINIQILQTYIVCVRACACARVFSVHSCHLWCTHVHVQVSWESSTLGFWFTKLLESNAQFHTWIFTGRPSVFWMTVFFNPQGFLTAMRQEVTRVHKGWALDSVVLHNDVTKTIKEVSVPPTEGVYMHGLYILGQSWLGPEELSSDGAAAQGPLHALPVIHLYAVNTSEHFHDSKLFQCPVYKKPRRTDLTYITAVVLKTPPAPALASNPSHWILRGVALLCDIK